MRFPLPEPRCRTPSESPVMPTVPTDRRLHAPQHDREVLIAPPLEEVAGLVDGNVRAWQQYRYDLQGKPLAEVAGMARAELLAAARRWTNAYRDVRRNRPIPRACCSWPVISRRCFIRACGTRTSCSGVWRNGTGQPPST